MWNVKEGMESMVALVVIINYVDLSFIKWENTVSLINLK